MKKKVSSIRNETADERDGVPFDVDHLVENNCEESCQERSHRHQPG